MRTDDPLGLADHYDRRRHLVQELAELHRFSRLRSRREVGWRRLRIDDQGEWSELKSLDDMSVNRFSTIGPAPGLSSFSTWLDESFQCAKRALRRRQRQDGVCR